MASGSPSPASSVATQPETQDAFTPGTQFLTQPHANAPSFALCTQMTETAAPSSQLLATQLLVTQPITQMAENQPTAAEVEENYPPTSQPAATPAQSSQLPVTQLLVTQPITQMIVNQLSAAEFKGNDQPASQPTVAQPLAQPCHDAKKVTEIIAKQDEVSDSFERTTDAAIKGTAVTDNDAVRNPCDPKSPEDCVGNVIVQEEEITSSVGGDLSSAKMPSTNEKMSASNSGSTCTSTAVQLREEELSNYPHNGIMSPMLSTESTSSEMGGTEANASDIKMTNSPHRADAEMRNNAIGGVASDDVFLQLDNSHHLKRKVPNPYTRNRKPASAKRTLDQISCTSSSSSVASNNASKSANMRSNNDACANKMVAAAASASTRRQVVNPYGKQVSNPYAKPKQNPKHSVRNPYTKMNALASSTSPVTKNNTTRQLPTMKVTDTAEKKCNPPATIADAKPSPFRPAGMSFSLPMAERLPSRNVSYQPAEILAVGELYRHLYNSTMDVPKTSQMTYGEGENYTVANTDLTPTSRELESVRITGTLLCVSASCNDENNAANVYSGGTFILVGDPLDTTRFSKKEMHSKQDSEVSHSTVVTPSMSKATKVQLTSILKKKKASPPLTSSKVVEMSSFNPATLKSTGSAKQSPLTSATPAMKSSDTSNGPRIAVSRSKPMSRGILNTAKKKKLVYSGDGKRLSFGGTGVGTKSGGLLARKFITPKRTNSLISKSTLTNTADLSSRLNKGALRASTSVGDGSRKNPTPEHVIQHHLSPIIPVWVGPFSSGDGLDGSVVGDLVMVMGEIVKEHCLNCQTNIETLDHISENKGCDETTEVSSKNVDEENIKSGGNVIHQQLPTPLVVPTRIQGVNDAATSIAVCATKLAGGHSVSQTRTPPKVSKSTTFCGQCPRFVRARFVKNANGTDMRLQKEALRVRRKYLLERKRETEYIMQTSVTNLGLYSVGCGLPI